MKSTFGAAMGRKLDHRAAARQGRRAGRAGLSVDEAADSTYLLRLRRELLDERAGIAERLREQLAERESLAQDADAVARALRAGRSVLVARAREAARVRYDRYLELCATYGASWQRAHRDRGFAHIGWRCPRVPDFGEVNGDVDY